MHKFYVFVALGECGLGSENNRHFCPFRLGIGRALESNESGMMTLFFFRNNLPGKVDISRTCKMIHIFSRFWSPCSIRHTSSPSSLIFFNGRFFFFFLEYLKSCAEEREKKNLLSGRVRGMVKRYPLLFLLRMGKKILLPRKLKRVNSNQPRGLFQKVIFFYWESLS